MQVRAIILSPEGIALIEVPTCEPRGPLPTGDQDVRAAITASWQAARRDGEARGVLVLNAASGAGWLLERSGDDAHLALRSAHEFSREALRRTAALAQDRREFDWWKRVVERLELAILGQGI